MKNKRIVISGATGRMGRRLMVLSSNDDDMDIVGAIGYLGHPRIGESISLIEPEVGASDVVLSDSLDVSADVMIDFSLPEGTEKRVSEAINNNVAMVIGTTGMSQDQEAQVLLASKHIPIIYAANYSLGVSLILKVAAEVAKALGRDFDIEITEAHHNQKVDSPSGTAVALAKSICYATGRDIDSDLVNGRVGRSGMRTKDEIGMHAIRMGSVIGDHSVFYGSDFEIIEIAHRAQSRDGLAAGAVRAAKWLCGKEPGMYTMEDVLFR